MMIETKAIKVHPKEGIALRLPQRPYTVDLKYCLATILYSPETRIISMAHVYEISGPARYSADNAVESLIEEIIAEESSVKPSSLRAHLVGELTASLVLPNNRTSKVIAALRERKIPIRHKVLGGQFWKRVSILETSEMLVEEYLEDCVQSYGKFQAEREYRLVL